MMFQTVVCLAAVATVVSGHMCLISPPQRGSMQGINKKGAPDCILLQGPCGGRPAMKPEVQLFAHSNFTVTFQKNLDHWTSSSPGYFSVSLQTQNTMIKNLVTIPDKGEPSLYLYSVNVTMPDMTGMAVLQAMYVTKNPKAPPMFYQCSDVDIVKRP